jgi:hypothetical protein
MIYTSHSPDFLISHQSASLQFEIKCITSLILATIETNIWGVRIGVDRF